jgi:hypothetical protein
MFALARKSPLGFHDKDGSHLSAGFHLSDGLDAKLEWIFMTGRACKR